MKASVVLVVALAVGVGVLFQVYLRSEDPISDVVEERTCTTNADTDPAVSRFSKFLTFETLGNASTPDHIREGHHKDFKALLQFLEDEYSDVHEQLAVEEVGLDGWSRLFTWKGSNPALDPVLFISHYDVVPVDPGSLQDWTHPPFSGQVADGFVWGRGTVDVKFSVTSMLEALTRLIRLAYAPQRTLMFCFGHDEELGGTGGAALIADLLKERGIKLDVVVDEGGTIYMDGVQPLTHTPVALIGTAEKTYTSLTVTLKAAGGHSSQPPTDKKDIGAQIGSLLTYITNNQPPLALRQPMVDFFHALAPYTHKAVRPLLKAAHVWPMRELIAYALSRSGRETNALVRTTVAATKIVAGVADNVLPITGQINLNARSHPDVSRDQVVNYVEAALAATGLQGSVQVSNMSFFGASGVVTPTHGRHFALLKQSIQELWRHEGQAIPVVPYLLTGGTDSKHFAGLTQNGILRFVPYRLSKVLGEVSTIHSTNERVRVEDYLRSICTYERMLQLLSLQ